MHDISTTEQGRVEEMKIDLPSTIILHQKSIFLIIVHIFLLRPISLQLSLRIIARDIKTTPNIMCGM